MEMRSISCRTRSSLILARLVVMKTIRYPPIEAPKSADKTERGRERECGGREDKGVDVLMQFQELDYASSHVF